MRRYQLGVGCSPPNLDQLTAEVVIAHGIDLTNHVGFEQPDFINVAGAFDSVDLAATIGAHVPSPSVTCPRKVSTWRLHVVAELEGLTASINTALASLSEPAKTVATIGWNRSFETERDAPLVAQLGTALGISTEDMDGLFRAAAALPVDGSNPTP